MLNESKQKPKPRRQHSTHNKKTGLNKPYPNRNRKRERREEKKEKVNTKTQEKRQHARGIRILQTRKEHEGGMTPRRNNRIT